MIRTVDQIKCEKDLLDYLKALKPIDRKESIAIIGGHYLLYYDVVDDVLKPLIHQDLKNDKHIEFAKLMAGDFPVKSFETSLILLRHFRDLNINSGIILVVNDHQFQQKNFQPTIKERINGKTALLKRNYFSREDSFPKTYHKLIKQNGYSSLSDVLYNNSDPKRSKNSVLPKDTFYYSEQAFRTKIDNKLKKNKIPQLLNSNKISNKGNDFYFEDICLTETGNCGCSLEVIEFFSNLYERKFHDIIFFGPSDCKDSIITALEIFFRILQDKLNVHFRVILVTGLGEFGKSISTSIFSYNV